MLIFSCHIGQKLRVGDGVDVNIVDIVDGQVRFGIVAPKSVSVHREEVYEKIKGQVESSQEPTSSLASIDKNCRTISNGG